ncbi:MAG: hypothetical protein C4531_03310 [Desulfurivibrio sp.]|jgi:hypothetical protein|nr:MAG: hypothetical protein C4531_03310 [Desulfurivibrio sp.]
MIDTTRRKILKTGLIGAVAGGSLISGLSLYKVREAQAATAVHPYGYYPGELDADASRQLAYDSFFGVFIDGAKHSGCAFATFHALISQLAELHPEGAYGQIPTQMMEWAAGGVAGYGSICGTLNGASAALGLICANAQAKSMIGDLLNWSATTLLPTRLSENNLTVPSQRTYELEQSISGGNLCHMSVTNWCLATGYASGSEQRIERCARLAGDVAARVVDMLNGVVVPAATAPVDKTSCGQCHKSGTDFDAGQFTLGRMDCTTCHIELEKVPENGHHWYVIRKPE